MHFLRVRLLDMTKNKLIDIHEDRHYLLGNLLKLNSKLGKVLKTLDNTIINAKLTDEGREYLKKYYLKFNLKPS